MSTPGPFLYDESPETPFTGTPRSRKGLLAGILAGTVAVAVAAVVALPLIRGTAHEQAQESAGVFLAALAQGDTETAYGLLCADERARLTPDGVAAAYLRPGRGRVVDATDADHDGVQAERVEVRWTADGAPATTYLTVVNEDGAHVCGTSAAG
jgi:hypothetical protein